MSAPLRTALEERVAALRTEAAALRTSHVLETKAMARAAAIVGKRVPDQLLGELRAPGAREELRTELAAALKGAPVEEAALLDALAPAVEALVARWVERAGDRVTDLTQAWATQATLLDARAALLTDEATSLERLIAAAEPPPAPATPTEPAPPPGADVAPAAG